MKAFFCEIAAMCKNYSQTKRIWAWVVWGSLWNETEREEDNNPRVSAFSFSQKDSRQGHLWLQ